jgi:hypothetical protein
MSGNWRNIAELIGMGAVVVSLLLVVFELRQTQVAISAAAHSDRTLRNFEILRFSVEHHTSEIQSKISRGETITVTEGQVLDNQFQMWMRHFEDLHYQHEIGVINDETWEANMEGLRWTMSTRPFNRNRPQVQRLFRPGFVELVEQLSETL